MLLGRIILGVVGAALAASVIVICISGTVSEATVKEEMRKKEIGKSMINKINRCTNTINFVDLESGTEYQIQGDDIDYDIDEGDTIYA